MKLSDKIDKVFEKVVMLTIGINIGAAFHFVFPKAVAWPGIISLLMICVFFLIWLVAYAAEEKAHDD